MKSLKHIEKAIEIFEKEEENINIIVNNNWCNYCGACFIICPVKAIEYDDGDLTINDKCIHCSKCLEICSQNQIYRFMHSSQFQIFDTRISKEVSFLKNVPIGLADELFITKAKEKTVFNNSMVGGSLTSILLYLVEQSEVDAVIISDFSNNNIFPEGIITDKRDAIIQASGSKYLPTFLLRKLELLSDREEIRKIAIVTLPCQAYVIHKLRKIRKLEKITSKIEIVISLLCGNGIPSKKDVLDFFKKKNVDLEGRVKTSRRKELSKKFLNPMNANRYNYELDNGLEYSFSSREMYNTKKSENCRVLCSDYTGLGSDISIGAASLKTNFIISRNRKATNIVKNTIKTNYLQKQIKFSNLNKFLIKIMGYKKRLQNHKFYEEKLKNFTKERNK